MDLKQFTVEEARGIVANAQDEETHDALVNAKCGDIEWSMSTLEAMRGGLAALRSLAEYAEAPAGGGIEDALEPHFDAIGAILEEARAVHAANLRTIKSV